MQKITYIDYLIWDTLPYYGQKDVDKLAGVPKESVRTTDGGVISHVTGNPVPVIPLVDMFEGELKEEARKNTYICYSPIVENILGIPINLIYRELIAKTKEAEDLRRQLHECRQSRSLLYRVLPKSK